MKHKKEKLEHLLQLLSDKDKRALKGYLKTTKLQKDYNIVLAIFKKHNQTLPLSTPIRYIKEYSYGKFIDAFYTLTLDKLPEDLSLEIRLLLLEQYPNNKLLLEFQEQYAEVLKPLQTLDDYHRRFKAQQAIYFSPENEAMQSKQNAARLQQAEEELEVYYATHKLRLTLEKINRAYTLESNQLTGRMLNVALDCSSIRIEQHPILLVYHSLYQLLVHYHHQEQLDKSILTQIKAQIQSEKLAKEHKEFVINTLIIFLNTQPPVKDYEKIHQLYVLGHEQGVLYQQGSIIYFSDVINLLSSAINNRDIRFLEVIKTELIPHANHQESLGYICEVATLFLHQDWLLLANKFHTLPPLPPIDFRLPYLIHLHVLKIKTAIESYVEQMDYVYDVDFDTLIRSYLKLIHRKEEKKALPLYLKEQNLAFKTQLEKLIKTFAYMSKEKQQMALQQWHQELPSTTMYYTWLDRIHDTISNHLR